MANTKEYKIVINGITESVKAVDALNESLKTLEERINALSNKAVNVSSGGGTKSSSSSALSEEAKLEKQIAQLEEKRIAHSKEIYQNYLAAKDVLKETENDQKQIAASERLAAKTYSNTIQGMKQELADIKSVMQTVDLGDSDQLKKMVDRANELNEKLKEIEQSYGQFGRNVGNYASAADGFGKLKVAIGDTIREYDTYKQAVKELKQERFELSQSIGTEAEEYKKVDEALRKLESSYKDLETSSAAMDKMLDTMQSIVSIASVGKGLGALFGINNNEIEKSIQKLVALQNVLQGVEKIRQQIKSDEFFGGTFAKANKAIDNFVASLTGANKQMKNAQVQQKAVAAGNVSIATSAGAAAIATKALSFALKTIGIGVALTALAFVVEGIQSLAEALMGTSEAAEKAKESLEEIEGAGAKAYVEATEAVKNLQTKVDSYNSSLKTEAEFLKELQTREYSILGTYKTVAEYKQALIDKSKEYIDIAVQEAMVDAKLQVAKEAYIEEMKKIKNGGYHHWYRTTLQDEQADVALATHAMYEYKRALEEATKAKSEFAKIKLSLGLPTSGSTSGTTSGTTGTTGIKTAGAKIGKTVKEVEAEIAKMRVDAMKQGFSKTLLELQLERDRRIEEAKKTGKLVAQQIEQINANYNQKIFDAKLQLHQNILDEERRYAEELIKIQKETSEREFYISNSKNQREKDDAIQKYPYTAVTSSGRNEKFIDAFTYDYNLFVDESKGLEKVISKYKELEDRLVYINKAISDINNNQAQLVDGKDITQWSKELLDAYAEIKKLKEEYKGIERIASFTIGKNERDAFATRLIVREQYYEAVLKAEEEFSKKELELEKERLGNELKELIDAEEKRHELMVSNIYDKRSDIGSAPNIKDTPKQLFEQYLGLQDSGKLVGKDLDELGEYLAIYREYMDEWLNELDKELKEGKIKWDEYISITGSTLLESYIQAKTDYEQFLDEYNHMSAAKQKKNEEYLNELRKKANTQYALYLTKVEEELKTHEHAMLTIQNEGTTKLEEADRANKDAQRKAQSEYFSNIENEYDKAIASISRKIDKSVKRNSLGFVNFSSTKKQLQDLEKEAKLAEDKIKSSMKEIRKAFEDEKISTEQYDALVAKLSALSLQLGDVLDNIKNKMHEALDELMKSINDYIQMFGQSIGSILGSLSEISSNQYDKMIEEQEDYIDKYQKLFEKQQEITQKYTDSVNDIEDELATSRGDRRQHLIDQLNAEMDARRASYEEEKRIEKEKEKAEKKKKKLEHDQAVAKKRMDTAQAYINAAMAISMAAVNHWPLPAIPMIAMATAVGAAQIAAVKSQNIPSYGSGGIIEGKSHAQGGVKVLGGRAEVEGGEFITNRISTQMNAPLLEFINSKKKRIDISDLLDFYSSGTVKKNISTVKSKFEDGGYIPVLPNQLDIREQLQNVIINQDNRPIYVSVVDINNKQDDVRRVQTLAGL